MVENEKHWFMLILWPFSPPRVVPLSIGRKGGIGLLDLKIIIWTADPGFQGKIGL